MLLASFVLLCCISFTESSAEGWTDPSGPIIQLSGSEIRIKCGVKGYSSDRLGFFNGSEPVNLQYVRKINDSVIEMRLPNAGEQESSFVCKLNQQHGISYNDVKIGRYPENITGLKCLSDNWHAMNCSFRKPYNPVAVHYVMKYHLPMSSQIYLCNEPNEKDPVMFRCDISHNAYRRTSPKFEFILTGLNAFGNMTQKFEIDNFASVIPAPPENFRDINITSRSVVLRWNVNPNLLVFPNSFDYEFLIKSPNECDSKTTRLLTNLPSTDNDKPSNFTQIIELNYANTWNDINIRMKISSAPNDEEMWSKWTKLQVKTTMREPDKPPVVDVGSFNIGQGEDVYIYWKHLPKCYQNGANYSYMVKSSNKPHEFPSVTDMHVAIYTKDRVNLMKDTSYTIKNYNAIGASKAASTIVIPGRTQRLQGPTKISKVLSNGVYKLTWSPPENRKDEITSYTVFWCVAKTELPNSCEGSIDFERRSPSKTHFELKSNQTVNFAISANSNKSTSGMVWARCTTANINEIGKIKTIWIPRLASTEIEVEWKLECTDSGIVAGFQLAYCLIEKPMTLECEEPEQKLNITGGLQNPKHTLTNLRPYKTYKIIIRMFSNSTMGPPSDPMVNTTLEAAPSAVRNLIARNIGNTSVELYWDPPQYSNGVLLYYYVWANNQKYELKSDDGKNKIEIDNAHLTRMNYTLTGLTAYTEYDIVVEVCTKDCSQASRTKIKTTIGSPGGFEQQPTIVPRTMLLNNYTSAVITWKEPQFKGGELDYYEFRTKYTARDGTVKENIIKTRKIDCEIEKLCFGDVMFYDFSVRAVNFVLTPHSKDSKVKIEGANSYQKCEENDDRLLKSLERLKQVDPHGWHLPGPWSPAIGHSCHTSGIESKQYIFLMIMMLVSLLIVVMVFYSYRKIKDMKDILVQMPPGLEDLTGDKMKKGKDLSCGMDEKPDILHNVDNMSINCEDENGQLLKRSLNGSHNGADCSSSLHSDSTKSEISDHIEQDEIEYGEFGHNNHEKRSSDDLTNFLINPTTGKEISPIHSSPESLATSTPVSEKCPKPNIVLKPKISMPSNGYVTQPPVKVNPPVVPMTSGYVTHSMFSPTQSSGYTPLNSFGRPIASQNAAIEDKLNLKTPIVATTDQEGISGYVTHKQLSDFGHRLQ